MYVSRVAKVWAVTETFAITEYLASDGVKCDVKRCNNENRFKQSYFSGSTPEIEPRNLFDNLWTYIGYFSRHFPNDWSTI